MRRRVANTQEMIPEKPVLFEPFDSPCVSSRVISRSEIVSRDAWLAQDRLESRSLLKIQLQYTQPEEHYRQPDSRLIENRLAASALHERRACAAECCGEAGCPLLQDNDEGEEDADDGVEGYKHKITAMVP